MSQWVRWHTDPDWISGNAALLQALLKALMRSLSLPILRASAVPQRADASTGSRCGHCALSTAGVACDDVTRRQVKQRHALYHQGAAYAMVFAVCSGTLKSTVVTAEGTERVIGFPMPGELLGLDGSAEGNYTTTTVALEDAVVCGIAPARLATLSAVAGLGREMLRMQQLLILVGSANADARLAQFLLNYALQLSGMGFSVNDFVLKMSRADIGSYLGLSLETVSRSFSVLQKLNLLAMDKRTVRICDLDGLACLAQSTHSRKWPGTMPTASVPYAGDYQIRTRPTSSAVIKT